MKTVKVVIGGCRYYNNYQDFCEFTDKCLSEDRNKAITILSGHCSGADMMAERYAKENGYELQVFPAQWNKYGRAAGPIRNKQMVELADKVIAFWDYKSAGTKTLIQYAKEENKHIDIMKI